MGVLFSQKTAKQMTFEDKVFFFCALLLKESEYNFRYNLSAFFLLFDYINYLLLTD